MKRNSNINLNLILALLMLNISFLFITSCEKESTIEYPTIRFYNATNANFFPKFGGCKYGEAEFLGKLESMSFTSYKEVNPGEYYVELQNKSGEWVPVDSTKIGPVELDRSYTISIISDRTIVIDSVGNASATGNDGIIYSFTIEQD